MIDVAEKIQMHGGPKDGQEQTLPFDSAKYLEIEATFLVDGKYLKRTGRYTRVHTIQNTPLSHFEWVGYHTPFVPAEAPKEISHD